MSLYSLSTMTLPGLPIDDIIDKIATCGFTCVELASAEHADEFMNHPARIKRHFDRTGIRPLSVHSPSQGWNNAAADPIERKKSVEIATACFAIGEGNLTVIS